MSGTPCIMRSKSPIPDGTELPQSLVLQSLSFDTDAMQRRAIVIRTEESASYDRGMRDGHRGIFEGLDSGRLKTE
jgi:hypothetical protein